MKATLQHLLASAVLAGAFATGQAYAADLIAKSFDTDTQEFGGGWDAPRTYSWDGTIDAETNAASGSLRTDVDFAPGTPNTTLQANLNVASFATYDKVRLSVYLDPATSSTNSSGHYGSIVIRLRPGWGWPGTEVSLGTITNTGWTHFEKPLPATATASAGLNVHWTAGYSDQRTIWLDNLIFVERAAPPPPPTLSLSKDLPGLEIRTTGNPDYSRKNIATVDGLAPYASWLNSTGAVTYSMTINESVEAGSSGYAANILLCAGTEVTIGTSPDWNLPSGIFMEAIQTTNGTYDVTVRYKTNAPNSHGIRFSGDTTNGFPGLLIERTNTTLTSLVGTWTLTLSNATVRLSGPGAISGSATLPESALEWFGVGNNFWALFGAQPYTRNNRTISLSRVSLSGPADYQAAVDQTFTTAEALDPNLVPKQEGTDGIILKPTNTTWRVSWGLPDTGMYLWSALTVKSNAWAYTGMAAITQGDQRTVWATNDSKTAGFFQLRNWGPPAEPILVESYETAVPIGANPPYTSIAQSSAAGVTEGTYSMMVTLDNTMTWAWITQDFGATTYADWKKRSKIRFDLHRPALASGWNLEVVIALNAPGATWTQQQLLNWVWLNGGASTSQTLEFDYSAMKAAAPATGISWQFNLLFRSGNGGEVYVDNVRFVD